MESYRVVPWADWSQWMQLKQLLMDANYGKANQQIAMYRTRRSNSIPLTILITSSLLTLLLNPHPDPYVQRLSLSMAITRFVNGTTDRLQPRGDASSARSVHTLAVQLGLPLVLVDIRHQASHNVLPRLSALTSGAKQALSWIATHYWGPQEESVRPQLASRTNAGKCIPETDEQSKPVAESEAGRVSTQSKKGINGKRERNDTSQDGDSKIENTPLKRRKRWQLCENNDKWKLLPLGLAPGQQWVPSTDATSPRRVRVECINASDRQSGVMASGIVTLDKSNKISEMQADTEEELDGRVMPQTRDQVAGGQWQEKPKALDAKEQAFVESKRNEFELLASQI